MFWGENIDLSLASPYSSVPIIHPITALDAPSAASVGRAIGQKLSRWRYHPEVWYRHLH